METLGLLIEVGVGTAVLSAECRIHSRPVADRLASIANHQIANRQSSVANRQSQSGVATLNRQSQSPIGNLNRQSPLSIGNRQSTKSAVRSRHSAMN
jgi:hypothetical protein